MMQNLWRFFLLRLLLTPALVGSVAVDLAAPPHVSPNGPVTTVEGDTVVQPAHGIEGPGNTSNWCAYNVPGQAAVRSASNALSLAGEPPASRQGVWSLVRLRGRGLELRAIALPGVHRRHRHWHIGAINQ